MTLTRCGWLAGLVAAAAATALTPSAPQACSQVVGPDFPTALIALSQLATLIVAGWILLVLVGALAQVRLPGVPRALRSALIAPTAVGVISVVALAGPAQADQRHDLAGLPLPDRPVATTPLEPPTPPGIRPASASTVTVQVQPGDTLWSLAASARPAGTSAVQITQDWQAWYDANRDVIGRDPDLITPGQVLTAPDTTPTEQDAS